MSLRLDPHAREARDRIGSGIVPGTSSGTSSGTSLGMGTGAVADEAISGSFPPVQSVIRAGCALGRAWLAFCDAEHQAAILAGLQSSCHAEDAAARDPVAMRALIAAVRAQGYATRDPAVRPVSNTIAVPVFDGDRAIASIGLTYFSSTLTTEQAVERYLPELQSAAGQISAPLASIDHPSTGACASLTNINHPCKETPWPLTPN